MPHPSLHLGPADQELLHRTLLEKQKLSLMGEVSYLKVKLADMEEKQSHGADRQHKAEVRTDFTSTFLNERPWDQVDDDDVIEQGSFSYKVQDLV